MTQLVNLLAAYTDDALNQLADQCEKDLYEAAKLDNNGDWHVACFCALHAICVEKNRRGMKPKATGVIQ
jgi:hypothetical protein